MSVATIPFRETNYFSALICNYLSEENHLKSFYNRFPKIENFESQINEKSGSYTDENRTVLVEVLKQQYSALNVSESTQLNIDKLANPSTFTVTTGHQLNLFTGPLYFLYKIISTINLCEELTTKHPQNHFVPIYWMATEDHDFLEINHFNFNGKKVSWNHEFGGTVGEIDTKGLKEVLSQFAEQLGPGINANKLKSLFESAYLKHTDLASATRYLANELFKDYGLVILDANHKAIKQLFIPYVKKELINQTSYKKVTATIQRFPTQYKPQVNPREINLFYITSGLRERIIFENDSYIINDTNISFSKVEMLKELEDYPERFSPNVLLRPLLQEIILPNLCYIGGGGELAYWLQLKSTFETFNVSFPMLLLRNSALIISELQQHKVNKLEVTTEDLFLSQFDLTSKKTKEISRLNLDFSEQKKHLNEQFANLHEQAKKTDISFLGAVTAQEKKQQKGLLNLEKRLLKAEKKKKEAILKRLTNLQSQLFPNQSLQERNVNFSEFYLEYGADLIPMLKDALQPLVGEFVLVQRNI